MARWLLAFILIVTTTSQALASSIDRRVIDVDGREAVVTYSGKEVRIEFDNEVWTYPYHWDGAVLSGGSWFGPVVMIIA